jgi:regulatory protein
LGVLLQDDKHLASAFRRLRNAGFSAGGSIKVLKRYAAEADRLEEIDEEEQPE